MPSAAAGLVVPGGKLDLASGASRASPRPGASRASPRPGLHSSDVSPRPGVNDDGGAAHVHAAEAEMPDLKEPTLWLRLDCKDLNLEVSLSVPLSKGGPSELPLRDLVSAFAGIGLFGTAYDDHNQFELEKFKKKMAEQDKARREQQQFYQLIQKHFKDMGETISRQQRDYYREIDKLREQLSKKKRDPGYKPEDVVFFDPSTYLIPSWEKIIDTLDGMRMKRELMEQHDLERGSVKHVPLKMLCDGCRSKFQEEGEEDEDPRANLKDEWMQTDIEDKRRDDQVDVIIQTDWKAMTGQLVVHTQSFKEPPQTAEIETQTSVGWKQCDCLDANPKSKVSPFPHCEVDPGKSPRPQGKAPVSIESTGSGGINQTGKNFSGHLGARQKPPDLDEAQTSLLPRVTDAQIDERAARMARALGKVFADHVTSEEKRRSSQTMVACFAWLDRSRLGNKELGARRLARVMESVKKHQQRMALAQLRRYAGLPPGISPNAFRGVVTPSDTPPAPDTSKSAALRMRLATGPEFEDGGGCNRPDLHISTRSTARSRRDSVPSRSPSPSPGHGLMPHAGSRRDSVPSRSPAPSPAHGLMPHAGSRRQNAVMANVALAVQNGQNVVRRKRAPTMKDRSVQSLEDAASDPDSGAEDAIVGPGISTRLHRPSTANSTSIKKGNGTSCSVHDFAMGDMPFNINVTKLSVGDRSQLPQVEPASFSVGLRRPSLSPAPMRSSQQLPPASTNRGIPTMRSGPPMPQPGAAIGLVRNDRHAASAAGLSNVRGGARAIQCSDTRQRACSATLIEGERGRSNVQTPDRLRAAGVAAAGASVGGCKLPRSESLDRLASKQSAQREKVRVARPPLPL